MKYTDIGLSNTREMFAHALSGAYAVPAFNFSNMEQLIAILQAASKTKSPVILAVSESALEYMGDNILMGMVSGAIARFGRDIRIALHLDHGRGIKICKHAIDIGFSSVMIDASDKPLDENISITKEVVEYAKLFNVTVESELGALLGVEDDAPAGNQYTNPADVLKFYNETNIDSLAVAIGTMHGAFKDTSKSAQLRFDILDNIVKIAPDLPLVLHGASSIPPEIVKQINKFGGDIKNANGIPADQLRTAVKSNICKINIDSDGRMSFTAGVREFLFNNPAVFDPRKYLAAGMDKMTELYIDEIKNIMGSENKC